MTQKIQKTENNTLIWNINLRVRVGQTVTYNGNEYTNITGKNSEPGTTNDWYLLGTGHGAVSSGTEIDLSNVVGVYYNMASADTSISYTYTSEVLGGIAFKKINCTVEPNVTGAIRLYKGDKFIANTDLYLVVKHNGTTTEFWFENTEQNLVNYISDPYGLLVKKSQTPPTLYLGTPSILKTSTGRYIASHDYFGSSSSYTTSGQTSIYYTDDINSENWVETAFITDMLWGVLFEYSGNIYILGTSKSDGSITISKSEDDGLNWSAAVSVLATPAGSYLGWQKTSTNVIIKDGYLATMADVTSSTGGWASYFNTSLILCDLSDIMNPANWSNSNIVSFNGTAFTNSLIYTNTTETKYPTGSASKGMLEGNLVELSNGDLRIFNRLEQAKASNYCVYFDVSWDSITPTNSTINTTPNYIDFLGGQTKFCIKYDSVSDKLWAISNGNRYRYNTNQRSELYLQSSSDDGVTWDSHGKIGGFDSTYNWEVEQSELSVSYPYFIIDGDNLVTALRCADEDSGDYHDNNIFSVKIVTGFRNMPTISSSGAVLVIDENSERVSFLNKISVIHDQSSKLNSPYILDSESANAPFWEVDGIVFNTKFLRLAYDRSLNLNQSTGISIFAVVENVQSFSSFGRLLSSANPLDSNDNGTGSYRVSFKEGLGVQDCRGNYSDMADGNDYIIASSYDNVNEHIYNYLNGANRGVPDTTLNGTWNTDHIELGSSFSSQFITELFIGKRIAGTPAYLECKLKALHIFPSYMTPTEMVAYMDSLNTTHSIY